MHHGVLRSIYDYVCGVIQMKSPISTAEWLYGYAPRSPDTHTYIISIKPRQKPQVRAGARAQAARGTLNFPCAFVSQTHQSIRFKNLTLRPTSPYPSKTMSDARLSM